MSSDGSDYEVRDDRALMHRVFVEEPEAVAEAVGNVPVCPTCLRAFDPGKYGPVVCEDCWDEHITASYAGGKRYVTENGKKKHYSPLCPQIRGAQYRMTGDEACVYGKLGPCGTCGPGGQVGRLATDGGESDAEM